MYWSNPRKPFGQWRELIDDILFNGLTIKEAAKKYEISQPAISQWLKKHPSIKKYYYTRPWVEKQRKLQFYPLECIECQELVDVIVDDDSSENYITLKRRKWVAKHLKACNLCRKYRIEKELDLGFTYRLDCPPLNELIDYLENGTVDTIITRHLLRCRYCSQEFATISASLPHNTLPIYLAEQEVNLYPEEGWRKALSTAALLEELINVVKENCEIPSSGLMADYCDWRILRSQLQNPPLDLLY